jgi:glycogen debranching enzyme
MTTAALGPAFDVTEIPFSHFGSWFGLSPHLAQHHRATDLHLVSHQNGMHPVLCLSPVEPDRAPEVTRVQAHPACLSWIGPAGRIDAVYESPDTLRLRGEGIGLDISAARHELTAFSGTYFYHDPVDGSYVFTSYETGRRYRVTLISGYALARHDQALGAAARRVELSAEPNTQWEAVIEEYKAARPPYRPRGTFDQALAQASELFAAFVEKVAPWRSERTPAAELAAYVLWSATVNPAGFLSRPAVLMSKHWMDKVWSWDHCFNALALADGEPALARDQYLLPFDHQDEAGALPDSVTHSEVLYNFVKPPIHGWALSLLRARTPPPFAHEDLADVYGRLERWTEYWLTRRAPGSALPHYHHGNDSGWDNATIFDPARVLESADLTAFLILQMRELAALASLAAMPQKSAHWAEQADALLHALIATLWAGDRFASRVVADGQLHTGESLLDTIPIVLGELLPAHIHNALAQRIAEHLTDYGPATEPPASPHYAADGYWRGPIWAPSTILIEHGLRECGHSDLADEISVRFRRLCETGGFAENFDAVTGAGQRDRAYTWTASSYLLFARAAELRGR